jgi:hypothetical protein
MPSYRANKSQLVLTLSTSHLVVAHQQPVRKHERKLGKMYLQYPKISALAGNDVQGQGRGGDRRLDLREMTCQMTLAC